MLATWSPLGGVLSRCRAGDQQDDGRCDRQHGSAHTRAGRQEKAQPRHNHEKPPDRRQLQPRRRREQRDACDAPGDVDAVGDDAVRHRLQRASELLPGAYQGERDDNEEHAGDHFYGDHELRGIARLKVDAKENELGRILMSDVDNAVQPAAFRIDQERRGERHREEEWRPDEIILPPARREAANRHAKKAGQEHRVREERQEQDVGGEPADAREFQKQDQQAD